MKKYSFVLILIAGCVPLSTAQAMPGEPLSVSVSFFGETLSHPGIAVGLTYDILDAGVYSLSLKSQAGLYIHPRNHSAVFLLGGIANRLDGDSGFTFDLSLQAGILESIPGGTVYERSGSGGIEMAGSPGALRFMAMAGLGFAWRLRVAGGSSFSPFIRLNAFGEYPFNGYLYPHVAAEAGIDIGISPRR
jgi:hypothetical protein